MEYIGSIDKIPEYLTCPICIQVPNGKMYQCRAGHFLCDECYSKVKNCPQCRAQLETEPIRALIVEKMLDELNLGCKYAVYGCAMKFDRKLIRTIPEHEKSCHFNIVEFGLFVPVCKKIGFKNCSFQMNRGNVGDAIKHFEAVHQACKHYSDTCGIEFQNYSTFEGGSKLIILDRTLRPQDVTGDSIDTILTLLKHNPTHDKRLTWLPFYLPNVRRTLQGSKEKDIDPDLQMLSSLYKVKLSFKGRYQQVRFSVSPLNILKCSDNDVLAVQLYMSTTAFVDKSSGNLFAELKVKRVFDSGTFGNSISKVDKIFTKMDMIGKCSTCLNVLNWAMATCSVCGVINPNYIKVQVNQRAPTPSPMPSSIASNSGISGTSGLTPFPSSGSVALRQSTTTDKKLSSSNFQFRQPQDASAGSFNFGVGSIFASRSLAQSNVSTVTATVSPSISTASVNTSGTSPVIKPSTGTTSFPGFSFGLVNVSSAAATSTATSSSPTPFFSGLNPIGIAKGSGASLLTSSQRPVFETPPTVIPFNFGFTFDPMTPVVERLIEKNTTDEQPHRDEDRLEYYRKAEGTPREGPFTGK